MYKRKLTGFNIDSPFRFGKYAGKPIGEVIKLDLQYVIWVKENLNATYSTEVKEAIESEKNKILIPLDNLTLEGYL